MDALLLSKLLGKVTTTVIIPRPSVLLVSLCLLRLGHLVYSGYFITLTSVESRLGLPPWHLEVKPSEHFS